jgi:hypothetical protein
MFTRLYLFLLVIFLVLTSCENSNNVEIELIGVYDFNGEYGNTINGKKTYDFPYRIESDFNQLMTTCSDKPLEFSDFLTKCIGIGLTKERLKNILTNNDIITSKQPIIKVLRNTVYTRQDRCSDWKFEPIEVIVESSVINKNRIYLYKINGKNKYRLALCP